MSIGQAVPSPEQIADIVARRAAGLPGLSIQTAQKLAETTEDTAERIRKLEAEVARKKRSTVQLQEAMFLLMEKYNFSPAEELVKLAIEKDEQGNFMLDKYKGTPEIRIGILEKLMEYTAPKLKSMEIQGKVEHEHTVNVVRWGDDGIIRTENIKTPGAGSAKLVDARVIDVEVKSE